MNIDTIPRFITGEKLDIWDETCTIYSENRVKPYEIMFCENNTKKISIRLEYV